MLDTGNGVIELFANAEPGRRPGQVDQTVPIKGLRQLTIPMASLPEQQEIVAVLDRLLGREEEVRQSAESVLAAIDSMKQSILARAFHGELGA